ncbi:MAG: CPBP family intramembrane glutamic endopeptidase [Longicatena sp.]
MEEEYYEQKKTCKTVSLAILCKVIMESIVAVPCVLLIGVFVGVINSENMLKEPNDFVMNIVSGIAIITSTIFVVKWFSRSSQLKIVVRNKEKKYPIKRMLYFTLLAMGISSLVSYLFAGVQYLLEPTGLVFTTQSFELDTSLANNIVQILLVCVVAPIFEEYLFRGYILGTLKKYGTVFAIVISAFVFSLMHGNLVQSLPTFFIGIVLAYVTIESGSLLPAICIHFINNTFAITELNYINSNQICFAIFTLIEIGLLVFAVIVIWRNRNKIKAYKDENLGIQLRVFFKNWASILLIIIMVLTSLTFIELR